ncbi:uncharacterized mitochondrial protein AtMg00810-like [Humulus lupulus]|uniref:uncharacterized mitochondrial protein AtMg00810-like n=1 Tax=Humulus lupulus TaxID=3486 RepID=UPI002B409114|nr:uncharacterized mitochondrial protein AtMg00810-like [Humulus lupulus]
MRSSMVTWKKMYIWPHLQDLKMQANLTMYARNNSAKLRDFIDALNKRFTLKDLGALHYFLGIQVHRDNTEVYLTQTKYIEELLQLFDMRNLKPAPTPMTAGKPVSQADGEVLANPTAYKSLIGALQHLCYTRPNIAFSVNKLSQFLQEPTTVHWSGAKRILRNLKGTLNHVIATS